MVEDLPEEEFVALIGDEPLRPFEIEQGSVGIYERGRPDGERRLVRIPPRLLAELRGVEYKPLKTCARCGKPDAAVNDVRNLDVCPPCELATANEVAAGSRERAETAERRYRTTSVDLTNQRAVNGRLKALLQDAATAFGEEYDDSHMDQQSVLSRIRAALKELP